MRKLVVRSILSAAVLTSMAGVASAGGSPDSWGVGGEFTLHGLGGASVNYDQGDFHAGGFLGYSDDSAGDPDDDWTLDLGGRFFYHLHSTAMSDFSVGAQLGMQIQDDGAGMDDDATIFEIDLGAQVRAFITSNVALSATLGIGILTADGEGEILTGDVMGVAGLHYYFF